MGKTFRRNDRWKKGRKDHNFCKSKKFKHQKGNQHSHRPVVEPKIEDGYDSNNDSDSS